MQKFLTRILRYGVSPEFSESKNQSIVLTNATAIAIPIAFIAIMNIRIITHPFERMIAIGLVLSALYACLPMLNKAGLTNLSRYLANIVLAYGILLLTLIRKMDYSVYESTYFVSRATLLVFSVAIPFTLFQFRETQGLLISMVIWLTALFLFDPIHNLFGVGYFQMGHNMKRYYHYNFVFLAIYAAYAFIVGYRKKATEDYEQKYQDSIRILDEKNAQIQRQKEKLADKNWQLTNMLNKQDQNLIEANKELLLKNNDLVHFSLAVSHNLRSPVASILGLINLLKRDDEENDKEKEIVLDHLSRSAQHLDSVTHDLNRIMDGRSNSHGPLEHVDLKEELSLIETSLNLLIDKCEVSLEYDLQIKTFFTARSYLHNILSQLITNGIQFRAQDRPSFVKILTYPLDNKVVVEVADNGLGINLPLHKRDLFKPFKQFHPNISGRGTGLYLVKLQVEKLQGTISIKSNPNVGTRVIITF